MNRASGPVAAMFEDLIRQGHITPVEHMEELRLPGEFASVPTILTYTTPEIPIRLGVHHDAHGEIHTPFSPENSGANRRRIARAMVKCTSSRRT